MINTAHVTDGIVRLHRSKGWKHYTTFKTVEMVREEKLGIMHKTTEDHTPPYFQAVPKKQTLAEPHC